MLLNAANAQHDMSALIARVLEYRVFAIVVMTGTPPARIVEECLSNGVPVILVNKLLPGLAVDTVLADHAAGGRDAALAILAEAPFDGVFCVTDLLALGFLDGARAKFRRRVPDDLSVIGFDDIPQAGWDAYRLTTFRQPVARLTGAVMDVLHRRKEHAAPHALTTVPVELVVRSTVRSLVAEESAC